MLNNSFPLKEVSIRELYISGEKVTYEIPIYQRNYAWEKDEIEALIHDAYDSFHKDSNSIYYIGTLVSFNKGDQIYEVIDGQQRLTTILLILKVLSEEYGTIQFQKKLSYRARKKSDNTLKSIPKFDIEETDNGIVEGYKNSKKAINEIVINNKKEFMEYFLDHVHLIYYQVPKDIDLNHYFEIMNSRGEQLEKHEIIKARLMSKLNGAELSTFNSIWEACSNMNLYVQQSINGVDTEKIFGNSLDSFDAKNFNEINGYLTNKNIEQEIVSINDILEFHGVTNNNDDSNIQAKNMDSFLPIIDFPNFLLIVLKIFRMNESNFNPVNFNLDDKELINEFNNLKWTAENVKEFAYLLLKTKYFLDNYVVHHSKEEDVIDSNPWKLQVCHKENSKYELRNTFNTEIQDKIVQLLSMFEVAFTARQRKNYLFYNLLYLTNLEKSVVETEYSSFIEKLSKCYFNNIYLNSDKLNSINVPLPGSFDEVILKDNKLNVDSPSTGNYEKFVDIYGDGVKKSNGIPLFVFNYLDYKLWDKYYKEMRGNVYKKENSERKKFFEELGCSDFELKLFKQFYFSRTRRSLEHFYPQANATGVDGKLTQDQINCLGNYAMIGNEMNSSASNWEPKTKLDHYLDSSGKIKQISVASLKFKIMMQICEDKGKWEFDEIKNHQEKMGQILFG